MGNLLLVPALALRVLLRDLLDSSHLGQVHRQVVGEPAVPGLEALDVSLYWYPYHPRLKHGRHNGFALLVVCV